MSRTRIFIVAAIAVVFVIATGHVVLRGTGGGGQNVSIDVTVTGAKSMSPEHLAVKQNDNVTINVRSDTDGEVHLHGYDIHFDTKAGQTVSHTFKADKTGGPYELEWESTSTHLGDFTVNP